MWWQQKMPEVRSLFEAQEEEKTSLLIQSYTDENLTIIPLPAEGPYTVYSYVGLPNNFMTTSEASESHCEIKPFIAVFIPSVDYIESFVTLNSSLFETIQA
jgi:hypothetical protein